MPLVHFQEAMQMEYELHNELIENANQEEPVNFFSLPGPSTSRSPFIHSLRSLDSLPRSQQDGYCYLEFLKASKWIQAVNFLGAHPSISDFLDLPSEWHRPGGVSIYIFDAIKEAHLGGTDKTGKLAVHRADISGAQTSRWLEDHADYILGSNPMAALASIAATPAAPQLTLPEPPRLLGGAPRGTRAFPTALNHTLIGPTIHGDAIKATLATRVITQDAEDLEICPFALSDEQGDFLASLGIPTSAHGTATHDHPMHKAIENFILIRVLGAHLPDGTRPMCMKANKVRLCPKLSGEPINPSLDLRDLGRYKSDQVSVDLPAYFDGKYLYIQDVGHYLTAGDIIFLFLALPTLERIFFTAILPPEALDRADSLFPQLYSLSYPEAGTLRYHLEGNDGDYYDQPTDTLAWLMTNQVGSHPVQLLQSVAAHHLFVVAREAQIIPLCRSRTFRHPDAVLLPQAVNAYATDRARMVPLALLDKAQQHAEHLRGYAKNDAAAKIRSLLKPEDAWMTPAARRYLQSFLVEYRRLHELQRFKLGKRWCPTLLAKLFLWAKSHPFLSVGSLGTALSSLCWSAGFTDYNPFYYIDPVLSLLWMLALTAVTPVVMERVVNPIINFLCPGSASPPPIGVYPSPPGDTITLPEPPTTGAPPNTPIGPNFPDLSEPITVPAPMEPSPVDPTRPPIGPPTDNGPPVHVPEAPLPSPETGAPLPPSFPTPDPAPVPPVDLPPVHTIPSHGPYAGPLDPVHVPIAPPPNPPVEVLPPFHGLNPISAVPDMAQWWHNTWAAFSAGAATWGAALLAHPFLTSASILLACWKILLPALAIRAVFEAARAIYRAQTELRFAFDDIEAVFNTSKYYFTLPCGPWNEAKRTPWSVKKITAALRPGPAPYSIAGLRKEIPRFRGTPSAYNPATPAAPPCQRLIEWRPAATPRDVIADWAGQVSSPDHVSVISSQSSDVTDLTYPDNLTDSGVLASLPADSPAPRPPTPERSVSSLQSGPLRNPLPPSSVPSTRPSRGQTRARRERLQSSQHSSAAPSQPSASAKASSASAAPSSAAPRDLDQAFSAARRAPRQASLPPTAPSANAPTPRPQLRAQVSLAEALSCPRSSLHRPDDIVYEPRPHYVAMPTDNLCLFKAFADILGVSAEAAWHTITPLFPEEELLSAEHLEHGWGLVHANVVASAARVQVLVVTEESAFLIGAAHASVQRGNLYYTGSHYLNTDDDGAHFAIPEALQASELAFLSHKRDGTSLSPSTKPPAGKFSFRAAPATQYPHFETDLASYKCTAFGSSSLVPTLGFTSFTTDLSRAKAFISDLKTPEAQFGTMFLKSHKAALRAYPDRWDSVIDGLIATSANRTVRALTITGFNGCGKSSPLWAFLRDHPEYFEQSLTVTLTRLLRDEIAKDIKASGPSSWRASTWESALLKQAGILIIDEIGKMPPGYVDFILSINPCITHVIALGDQCQLPPHHGSDQCRTRRLSSEITRMQSAASVYLLYTYRSSQEQARRWNVPSFNPVKGFALHNQDLSIPGAQVTYQSQEQVDKHNREHPAKAMTLASTQGFTFHDRPNEHVLDRDTCAFLSKYGLNMISNRSKVGFSFRGQVTPDLARHLARNPTLQAYLDGRVIDFETTFAADLQGCAVIRAPMTSRQTVGRMLGGKPQSTQGRLARRKRRAEEKAEDDMFAEQLQEGQRFDHTMLPPTLRVFLQDLTEEKVRKEPAREAAPIDAPPRTHFNPRPLLDLVRDMQGDVATEDREAMTSRGRTNQFPEDRTIGRSVLATPATNGRPNGNIMKNLCGWHSGNDETLLPFSKKKRLPMSTPLRNVASFNDKAEVGAALWEAFKEAVDLPSRPPPFNMDLYASCIEANQWSKLTSKTKATIIANGYKSDSDWRFTFVRIFMKGQQKVKEELINAMAKPGQTLAQFNDGWVLVFGPVVRYLTLMDNAYRPSTTFILAGHTTDDAADFARANIPKGTKLYTGCDYTRWDQSQGAEFLHMERAHMKYYGIPGSLIEFYSHQKVNLTHQFGYSAIMRFTGEPGTYKFNTDANEAMLWLQFEMRTRSGARRVYAVSGDDSLIVGVAPERPSYTRWAPKLTVVAKREVSSQALFCGYYYSPYGIVRDPTTLAVKLAIAIESKKLHTVLLSFCLEAKVGKSLGDSVHEVLTAEQIECHFSVLHCLWDLGTPGARAILGTGTIEHHVDSLSNHFHSAAQKIADLPKQLRRRIYMLYRASPAKRFAASLW